MAQKFSGLIAAPFSPLDSNGDVNPEAIPSYYHFLRQHGIRGAFINGTAGEGMSLSTQQRKDVAAGWLSSADENFTTIVHISHLSFPEIINLGLHAKEKGADAIAVTAPCFFKLANVKDLAEYLGLIRKEVPENPLFYYHIPSLTGANFSMLSLLQEIDGKIENFAGIKYSHNDIQDLSLCIDFMDAKYQILSGCEQNFLHSLIAGAQGAIGGSFSFLSLHFMKIMAAFKNNDNQLAEKLQLEVDKTIQKILKKGCFQACGKAIMRSLGIDLGPVLRPLRNLTPEEEKDLLSKYVQLFNEK